MMKKSRNLTEGEIRPLLTSLTIPMIFGMLGIIAFNLADTYFVGKLGTIQLAALTFTFPVVLVINSINLGLGVGAASVIARAVGEGNHNRVVRLSTDSLTLGLLFSITAVTIGEFTIRPLFTMLGASEEVLPYITQYMQIWYAGAPFLVIPMIGNSAIRALGDTKTPSIVMMVSAATNIVLDPIFIFGFGMIPALGVRGAAIATVISRAITFAFAMYVLVVREKVISLENTKLNEVLKSWKIILYIGVPNAIAKMIIPIGSGIITVLIAKEGAKVVAGYGIATRIEFLAMAVVYSLAAVIPVFVGQNYGGGKFDRIKNAVLMSEKFSVIYYFCLYAVLILSSRFIAGLFSTDPDVTRVVVLYMSIVPIAYMFAGVLQVLNASFNALNQPIRASIMNITQMLIVYVPLATWSSKIYGIKGIFISLVISYIIIAILGHIMFTKSLKKLSFESEKKSID